MKRRRSLLLDEDLDRRVQHCARERGTTFTEVVREVLEQRFPEPENPNEWLIDAMNEIAALAEKYGLPDVPRIPIESDEAKDQAARDVWRRKMNREPDW